jgi:hypothetical protein
VSPAPEPIARHELLATALSLGIERPDELSTEELLDAIRVATEGGQPDVSSPGWFAVARHLVESVVQQGLNLPSAAKVLRAVGGRMWSGSARQRPPLPTVTLAQIYLSQGHTEKARVTLTQVLARQPENHKAQRLLEELDKEHTTQAAATDGAPPERGDEVNTPASDEDVVVVVRSKEGVRVCWELAGKAAQLAPDQGVELLVRVFQPSPSGTLVREQRHPISTLTGMRGVRAEDRALVRAALVDVHDGMTVLGVASVFRSEGTGSLELDDPLDWMGTGSRARSLALKMLNPATS